MKKKEKTKTKVKSSNTVELKELVVKVDTVGQSTCRN